MEYQELPLSVGNLCEAFVGGLKEILSTNLHGVYMYGAAVFPDAGPIQDVDCHVILKEQVDDGVRDQIFQLSKDLKVRFPDLGDELDTYFILYEDARRTSPPTHQLRAEVRDESWALHCAHIRGGRYFTLYGPEPDEIFPAASWQEISRALDHEMRFIEENLKYPDYCVMNLCRIMYSFQERDVVVSKRFGGNWAIDRFPQWASLVQAAIRSYNKTGGTDDLVLLETEVGRFLAFASERIQATR